MRAMVHGSVGLGLVSWGWGCVHVVRRTPKMHECMSAWERGFGAGELGLGLEAACVRMCVVQWCMGARVWGR